MESLRHEPSKRPHKMAARGRKAGLGHNKTQVTHTQEVTSCGKKMRRSR